MMRCADCCYFWKEENESCPSCHWEPRAPGDMTPCDYEESYDEEDD